MAHDDFAWRIGISRSHCLKSSGSVGMYRVWPPKKMASRKWALLAAVVVSNGCQQLVSAMVVSQFWEATSGVQTLHSHASGGFQALRPRNSDSPGEVIVCHFFSVPNGPLEAPAVQKTYLFPRLWQFHFHGGRTYF